MRLTRPSFLFFSGLLISLLAFAQNAVAQSDPTAVALAAKSYLALTGGLAVQDAAIAGSATWIAGSDHFQGQVTLKVKGTGESRIDFGLDGLTRSEIRSDAAGFPNGAWIDSAGQRHLMATHNCWIDAAWFFPALFSVYSLNDPSLLVSYLGSESVSGISVHHIRFSHYRTMNSAKTAALSQHLGSMDVFLDASSLLPVAIGFNIHPDEDANLDIPAEVTFSDYQSVSGVMVPHHVQKFVNAGLVLDLVLDSVSINSNLSDADFSIQ